MFEMNIDLKTENVILSDKFIYIYINPKENV